MAHIITLPWKSLSFKQETPAQIVAYIWLTRLTVMTLWLEKECVDTSLGNQRRQHSHFILVNFSSYSFDQFYLAQSILVGFLQINPMKMISQ